MPDMMIIDIATAFLMCLVALAWFPCCPSSGMELDTCFNCSGSEDNAPMCWTVTFSGWADDDCVDCESYDGSYIACGPSYTTNGYCEWYWFRTMGTGCDTDREEVFVRYDYAGPLYGIRVYFIQWKNGYRNYYEWRKAQTTQLDCLEVADLDIPYYGRSIAIPTTGVSCDASGATCSITAGGTP